MTRFKLHNLPPPSKIEQRTVNLGGNPITFTLKRSSRRRSIGLRIDSRGLTISMPLHAPEEWLQNVLQEKSSWVTSRLKNWQIRKSTPPSWQDGKTISFLGEPLTLRVVTSLFAAPALHQSAQLIVHATDATNEALIKHNVMQWYQNEAIRLFRSRVAHYAPLLNTSPQMVKLSAARTRWGSCSVRGIIRLNWQLIKMPQLLIDYVVVHELAHLIEMNHSAAFWQLVETACPDYAKRRMELKQWQIELHQ